MPVLQEQEWLPFWEKCSFAHRQVDEQPTKWSKSKRFKKNDDKSAVAILKKGDWHEREHKEWETLEKISAWKPDESQK